MTALSAERYTKSRNLGAIRQYPLAAVAAYKGGIIMINSAGYATPAADAASNKGCVGVALETVDNSGGSAGDKTINVQEGEYLFAGATLGQDDIGGVVYANDDQTIDETQAANQPVAGRLAEYVSASEGWVQIGLTTAS